MDRNDWWTTLGVPASADLASVWIPVGLPGYAGEAKHRRRELLPAG